MTLKLGMCGYTIGAAAYFKQFRVVEIQQTFYDPPPLATIAKWRAQAPEDFEFTMKAWQVITHMGTSSTYRRLKRAFSDEQRAEAHGNGSAYARYTDDELRQLIAWLRAAGDVDAYVMFNNIPRVKDIARFRELLAFAMQ